MVSGRRADRAEWARLRVPVDLQQEQTRTRAIVADFYTFALFDLDAGAYGTYTDYDMPPANMQPGAVSKMSVTDECLDIAYDSGAGRATWRTCRDEQGVLLPYTYDVTFVGTDADGAAMRVDLHVTPSRTPVPLGAADHGGKIECFGQADTYSYLQTGMTMTGTLTWGSSSEPVTGSAGHVDRQWFPLSPTAAGRTATFAGALTSGAPSISTTAWT